MFAAKPLLVAVSSVAMIAGVTPSAFAAATPSARQKAAGIAREKAKPTQLQAMTIVSAASKQQHLLSAIAAQAPTGGTVVLVAHARAGDSLSSLSAAVQLQGASVRRELGPLGDVSFAVPAARASAVAAQLLSQPGVTSVSPAVLRHTLAIPNDTYYASNQSSYLSALNAPAAWSVEPGSPAVRIAIVDTGVDTGHPDLAGKIVGQYNAVTGTSDVTDYTGHGTFVAGVAAAVTNNALGVAGAGNASSLLAVKVEDANGDIWTDAEAAGVIWATDHGARIINLSLGSPTSNVIEQNAITYAQNHGVLVVAAAGNSGNAGNPVSYPAGYPSVLAVGATDAHGGRAYFSEYGSWVSVGAPGMNIFSTAPRAGSAYFAPSYGLGDGTSFSSPLVAGEAALLAAAAPSATATDLRNAVISSAHGYAGLGLGTGQVDFLAALSALAPTTTPVVTTPTTGGSVSASTQVTATSTAPRVRFSVDGSWLGNSVAVNAGSASTSWATWGSSNASHTIAAVDCSAVGFCASSAASVIVTVANGSPAVIAPSLGQRVSGAFTMTATAPGGGIAFLIDGARRGFDAAAPYSTVMSAPLSDGPHTIAAVECSADANRCAGPSSTAVTFTSVSLHPTFSSLVPAAFSPNGDGRRDTTTATFALPNVETVVMAVKNSTGAVVRSAGLGSVAAGTHKWVWNGLNNAGARVPDGAYTLTLATSRRENGTLLYGTASRSVSIDTAAPAMSSLTGANATVFPVVDGYADSFTPGVTVGEASTLSLTIRTTSGTLIRTLSASKGVGRTSITWNGRSATNALLLPGSYRWTYTATDGVGNQRVTAAYVINVSSKQLVAKSVVLTQNGVAAAGSVYDAPADCGEYSTALSEFAPSGLWIDNFCDPYFNGASNTAAIYEFTVPSAVRYDSLRLDVFGNTISPNTKLRGGFENPTTWATSVTSGALVTSYDVNAWSYLGTSAAGSLVNGSRLVDAAVAVTNEVASPSDFDIGYVSLTVGYTVLQ